MLKEASLGFPYTDLAEVPAPHGVQLTQSEWASVSRAAWDVWSNEEGEVVLVTRAVAVGDEALWRTRVA